MVRLTVVAFSAFSIIFLFTLFNPTDGVPFNSQIENELSDKSEITSDTSVMIKSRKRRDIISSMISTILSILGFPFQMIYSILGGIFNLITSIVMAPINLIGGLIGFFIDLILSTFSFIFRTITWPFSFFFSSNDNPKLEDASNNSSSSSTDDENGTRFLERLESSLRDWMIDMMWKAWEFSKEYILPRLDEMAVTITHSTFISDDVKSFLNTVHSAYEMLHMLKIL